MTVPATTKDAALNAITFTHVSFHTAFPGLTGASEVTGGTPPYVRPTVTVNASSSGVRTLSATASSPVPICTIRWYAFWNGSTLLFCAPAGGATPINFTVAVNNAAINVDPHSFTVGAKVVFNFGNAPAPFVEGTTYYVVAVTASTVQLSATSGGAAIIPTGAPGYGCNITQIVDQVYGAQDTHSFVTFSFTWPS